jgi:hypothetical protein
MEVATSKNPNPVSTVAGALCHLSDTFSPGQQPDNLKVTAFDRAGCLSVTILQFINADVCSNADIFGHWRLLLSKLNLFKRRFFQHFVFGESQQ